MSKLFLWTIIICFIFSLRTTTAQNSYRDTWQQPERIMDSIGVQQGMIIGEAGAGAGYFTFKLARRVGQSGLIYANDINEEKLTKIQKKCRDKKLHNIKTILGEVSDPLFPDSTLDMIIMVYVFHDLEKPLAFLKNLPADLKPGARIVIVERDPQKTNDHSGHFMEHQEILDKIEQGGFKLERFFDFLERDNIYILKPGF